MIIDDVLSNNNPIEKAWVKSLRGITATAQRFSFSDEASLFLGKFIRECGDILLNNRQFALAPYPRTYIEMSSLEMTKAIGRTTTNDAMSPFADKNPDSRLGYLIDGNDIWVFAGREKAAHCGMFRYRLNSIGPRDNLLAFGGHREEWSRLALFLGSTVHDLTDEHTRNHILSTTWFEAITPTVYGRPEFVLASGGDIRNVWAMLLLLNQPKNIRLSRQSAMSVLRRGKRVAYAAHNIVEIELGKRFNIRRDFHFTDRSSPRRHSVRGHFAHYNIDRRCEHSWPLLPDVDGRWGCSRCGGFRVWRDAFERGDASKGYTTKTYNVTE